MPCLRKKMDSFDIWEERGVENHKHDFQIPYLYAQKMIIKPHLINQSHTYYYLIHMCTKCHSFKGETNWVKPEDYSQLQCITGIHYNQSCRICDADELYFSDNTSWKKK